MDQVMGIALLFLLCGVGFGYGLLGLIAVPMMAEQRRLQLTPPPPAPRNNYTPKTVECEGPPPKARKF